MFTKCVNSGHTLLNLMMLVELTARMRPGGTDRFGISTILFGSAAFNLRYSKGYA